jgi:prepilin-type N-terminal cleavage/methylation domain-containing protein
MTLVELIIVIAIIGILSAVVLPNFVSLGGSGNSEAAAYELSLVQNAMDRMMAKNNLTGVAAVSSPTDDMAVFPDSARGLYPAYLRSPKTTQKYSCTASGLLTQNASSTSGTTPGCQNGR